MTKEQEKQKQRLQRLTFKTIPKSVTKCKESWSCTSRRHKGMRDWWWQDFGHNVHVVRCKNRSDFCWFRNTNKLQFSTEFEYYKYWFIKQWHCTQENHNELEKRWIILRYNGNFRQSYKKRYLYDIPAIFCRNTSHEEMKATMMAATIMLSKTLMCSV